MKSQLPDWSILHFLSNEEGRNSRSESSISAPPRPESGGERQMAHFEGSVHTTTSRVIIGSRDKLASSHTLVWKPL
ncbi:hypothetical protein CEXT_410721 [Caerostris extrusa]|uniref:Uncharacterized protein n=1 Tax=Caerostris extrusa TaxID=172846 RepID=A0AAV4RBD7_CAEEX|nr:hypothetical protein CEXT_410721 [Caerostris extrusa]